MMKSRGLWAIVALLVCQSVYLYSHFPGPEQYMPAADEGTFFREATVVLDRGMAGWHALAQDFLARPELQVSPPPTRIGHVLLAAGALSIDRSFRMLSVLSLSAHVLTVLLTYGFVRRWSGDSTATCASILVATSPLASGLATRALSDCDYRLFSILAAFLCIDWSLDGGRRTFAWFLVALTWSAIVKEMTFVWLPVFAALIVVSSVRRWGRVQWLPLVALGVVPVVVILVDAMVFGGVRTAVSLIATTFRMNTMATNDYLRLYHNGPWFTFFVDALLLAPVATLAFLLTTGWYVTRRPAENAMLPAVFILIAAGIAVFAALPQNPRYSNPLDALVRIFLGAAIVAIARPVRLAEARHAVVAGAVAILAIADVASFHRLFVDQRIYDPIPYNLAIARNLGPSGPVRATLTADEYVAQGLAYYRARDYEASIAMSQRALTIGGESAVVYNNMGAAYCELGRWAEAITALNAALRLKPDFALARNNLAWAQAGIAAPPGGRR